MLEKQTQPMLKILLLVQTLLCILVAFAGHSAFWTDSEMWSSVAAQHLFSNSGEYDFAVKPLFDFILFLNFYLAKSLQLHPMVCARAIFAGNTLFCVYLFWAISRKVSHNVLVATVLSLALIGNSFFVKRFSSVRSDILVTTLFLILLLVQIYRPNRKWLAVPIFILAYLITPKSVLISVCWALAFAEKQTFRRLIWAMGAAIGLLIAISFFNSNALHFFLSSFTFDNGLGYWDPSRLEHLSREIKENPLVLFMWIFGVAMWRSASPQTRPYLSFSNLLLILMLVYPDRLPFFIAALLPFWLLPFASEWPHLKSYAFFKNVRWIRVGSMVVLFSVASGIYWSSFLIQFHNNQNQLKFINWLDQFEKPLENLSVYDPVGVLPFSKTAHRWFLGPAEAGNEKILQALIEQKVEVIFFTAKLHGLGPSLVEWLEENYWHDQAGIFIRKSVLTFHEGKLKPREIRDWIFKDFSRMQNPLDQEYYVRLLANGVDLTPYAKWHTLEGEVVPFSGRITLRETNAYERLVLPPTVNQMTILPIRIETPYSADWSQLFRFDPEI